MIKIHSKTRMLGSRDKITSLNVFLESFLLGNGVRYMFYSQEFM